MKYSFVLKGILCFVLLNFSCQHSRENAMQEVIVIDNSASNIIHFTSLGNTLKDLWQIIISIGEIRCLPDSLNRIMGKPKSVYMDSVYIGNVISEGSFYMTDNIYAQYQYDKRGFLKKYVFTHEVKYEDCFEILYEIEEGRLHAVKAYNPNLFINNSSNPTFIFSVSIKYNQELISSIIVKKQDNTEKIYTVKYN